MEIKEFQEKLVGLCAEAAKNEKRLKEEQVREAYAGMELNQEQYQMIYKYLRTQGILIEGVDVSADEEPKNEETQSKAEKKENPCLTDADKEYLKEYLKSLSEQSFADERMVKFMPMAVSFAADMYRDGMNLADLIQEANLSLLMILAEAEKNVADHEIAALLKKGVKDAANAQDEQNFGDESLVAKVQNLDTVMKELTEGDEGEPKFSVEELAIMLDMDIDEMQDIIRLTGDL